MLVTIENIFPPIPSELILTLSGFLSIEANLNLTYLIISSTIGSLLGALILYFLGYKMGYSLVNKLCKIKCLHFNKNYIDNSLLLFKTKGIKTIFLSRLIPIVRSLISIPAGISKMNLPIFIIFTFLGSFIWNSILILTGNILGENYDIILYYLDKYKLFVLIIISIYIITKIRKKTYNKMN